MIGTSEKLRFSAIIYFGYSQLGMPLEQREINRHPVDHFSSTTLRKT